MKLKIKHIELIGAFCLGFSLSGIFGLLDGVILSIALICYYYLQKSADNSKEK